MRTSTSLALAALVAVSLSGCGLPFTGDADPKPADPPTSAPASTPAALPSASAPSDPASTGTPSASASDPSAAPTPADPSQPQGGNELGAAVATRDSSKDGAKISVTVYPIKRDGTTSHLNLSFKVPAGGEKVQLDRLLTDGNSDAGDKGPWSADGMQLVDGKHSKLYLVASDGAGQCLCSRELIGVFATTAPMLVSATFAAPPADVTEVDVRIPGFGTVSGVPIQ